MKNKESIIETNPLEKWENAIQIFEKKAENAIVALDKFETTLNDVVEEETYQLFEQDPQMPLSKVIASVFEGINENTPPNLLVKLTKKIINIWHKLQTSVEPIGKYELA